MLKVVATLCALFDASMCERVEGWWPMPPASPAREEGEAPAPLPEPGCALARKALKEEAEAKGLVLRAYSCVREA